MAPADRESVADRVVQCTQAGNPYSDEEGEDLVAQCEQSVRAIYCTREVQFLRPEWGGAVLLPCSAAVSEGERKACRVAEAAAP